VQFEKGPPGAALLQYRPGRSEIAHAAIDDQLAADGETRFIRGEEDHGLDDLARAAKLRALAEALRAASGNPPYWESSSGLSGDEPPAGTL
jgi:hypothetical protein